MRTFAIAVSTLLLMPGPSPAVIFVLLEDEFDDRGLVDEVRDRPAVKKHEEALEAFREKLYRLKEKDLIAFFGPAQRMPAKTYAMPVAQHRGLGLSGLTYEGAKRHTDFYAVKDVVGLEVYYGNDGETPMAVVFYFPVDKDFPKLTADNLDKRLAWDQDHLDRLLKHYEQRRPDVFPWEIDREELARFHQGDFSVDAAKKLEAWFATAKALGYTYKYVENIRGHHWYGSDGRLVRSATHGRPGGPPGVFTWHRSEPNQSEIRQESFETPTHIGRRWQRPNGPGNIRWESPSIWHWYGLDGSKPVRMEWDDNGDGIPDWYVTGDDGTGYTLDEKAIAKRKPLKVEASWAVDPKLIPEASRIPDQPDLRLPLRRTKPAR